MATTEPRFFWFCVEAAAGLMIFIDAGTGDRQGQDREKTADYTRPNTFAAGSLRAVTARMLITE